MSGQPAYTVRIKRSAEREMDRLHPEVFQRLAAAILQLETKPRPRNCKKLRGVEEYRLRVGAYRVLYTVDDKERIVNILSVGHRSEVYRGI